MKGALYRLAAAAVILGATAGCTENGAMNRIEKMWADVLSSSTPAEELRHVEALRSELVRANVAFDAVVTDESGRTMPHLGYSGETAIRSVRFTFRTEQGEFAAPEWSPKSEESYFALFRE